MKKKILYLCLCLVMVVASLSLVSNVKADWPVMNALPPYWSVQWGGYGDSSASARASDGYIYAHAASPPTSAAWALVAGRTEYTDWDLTSITIIVTYTNWHIWHQWTNYEAKVWVYLVDIYNGQSQVIFEDRNTNYPGSGGLYVKSASVNIYSGHTYVCWAGVYVKAWRNIWTAGWVTADGYVSAIEISGT